MHPTSPTPEEPINPQYLPSEPQPVVTPPLSSPVAPAPITSHTSPGVLVLQWLTYAFWGWTLLILSILAFIVIYNLIDQADTSATIPYVLAAILVLLPISLICDFFYRKYEVQKKQGASMVIMVIHAVIFALFAIGVLVGCIFSVVQLLLASGDVIKGSIADIISCLIIAILYGLTFLRTLNPFAPKRKIALLYNIIMLVVAGVFIVLSITGPFMQSLLTKNDRLIESDLSLIQYNVNDYIDAHDKLPGTLADVSVTTSEARQLITDNLVTYKPVSSQPIDGYLRYQLCATYAQASHSVDNYNRPTVGYQEYLGATVPHPKGQVCYKLEHLAPEQPASNQLQIIQEEPKS